MSNLLVPAEDKEQLRVRKTLLLLLEIEIDDLDEILVQFLLDAELQDSISLSGKTHLAKEP